MEEKGITTFPKPVFHRIPNFVGAEKAAENLRKLAEYKTARTIFCNPDSPQRPLRKMALRDGKVIVMATPKIKEGFLLLDPSIIPQNRIPEASTVRGAFKYGRFIKPSEVKIDLFVAGSVAVSLKGWRLGKGTGYSDQEYAILKETDSLRPDTLVATTVHDVQVVDFVSQDQWDIPVDVIATPTKLIRVK